MGQTTYRLLENRFYGMRKVPACKRTFALGIVQSHQGKIYMKQVIACEERGRGQERKEDMEQKWQQSI